MLVETARRLTASVRDTDLVCRIGGDEFVLIVSGDRVNGLAIAERVVTAMRSPIVIGHLSLDVRASVGGVWTAAKGDIGELISRADQLLYHAKETGKDGIQFEELSSDGGVGDARLRKNKTMVTSEGKTMIDKKCECEKSTPSDAAIHNPLFSVEERRTALSKHLQVLRLAKNAP